MVYGLISYPRSGNTLLRLILAKVFGVNTMSVHDTGDSGSLHKEIGTEINHMAMPGSFAQTEDYYIKSHLIDYSGMSKIIYVIRDGRCACISYYHHLNDNGRPTTYDEVFKGVVYGSWSFHADFWVKAIEKNFTDNCLILRYEKMVKDPESVIDLLSMFCNIKPKNKWVNEFDRLHGANPQFFRKGNNEASIEEFDSLQPESKELFWGLHTGWMIKLGYIGERK